MLRDTKSMLDEISMKREVSAHIHTLNPESPTVKCSSRPGLLSYGQRDRNV